MKFLIIQENGHHEKNRYFRECFSTEKHLELLGHEAHVWGLGHLNYDKLPEFDAYDAIINLENYDVTGWVPNLADCKAFKILWSIDSHCRGVAPYYKTAIDGKYNLVLQATRDFVDQIPKSLWFPNCYDSQLVQPLPSWTSKKEHLVGFCGNYVNRKELIDSLDEFGIKKDIFKIGYEMVRAINSYQIGFNKNMAQDINYRNFETCGCDTMLLTDFLPAYQELGFKHGENCVFYNSVDMLKTHIRELAKAPEEIKKISRNGLNLVFQNHSYTTRMGQLLDILKTKV